MLTWSATIFGTSLRCRVDNSSNGSYLTLSFNIFCNMKLSAWAKSQGIVYLTAYRMWRSGRLPVPAYQTATGTIIVDLEGTGPDALLPSPRDGACALYARVSGH